MVNQTDKTNAPGEVIDLVGDNDQVIGETTKGEANSNPNLWHREIRILIFDDAKSRHSRDKRVLIQKQILMFRPSLKDGLTHLRLNCSVNAPQNETNH